MNLPGFPVYRPRRLRQSPALRKLVCETRLSVEQFVLPLFARSGRELRRSIEAMPGVCQSSPRRNSFRTKALVLELSTSAKRN
jgi:porphobilinogen synthase